MTDELKRIYTYNGGVTAVLKTPIVITDTTAYYRIGQSPRVWIGSSFKVFSDASGTTQYVLGVDYVLDQHYVDIDISKQVGEACYSYLKFIKEARTIYVDMDVVGSHVDGAIINELIENDENHAATLADHAGQFTAINNKNNEQDLRLSVVETVNNAQNVTLDDHEARLDNLSNVTNDAQLKRAAGDLNSFSNKATIANGDIFIIEDSEDGYSKKKVSASQITSIGGGGGDVFGPASSVSDDIALFDGATGKLLKDSGRKLNTGTAAGTVPVRDANGKVPGSITGDADTLDGYHANTGTTASTVPVRNASGIIPGSISGNAATATRIGARTTADESGWEYATQCPDNYGITWLGCSGKWWSYNNQDAPEPSTLTYFEITAITTKEFLIVAYTLNNTVYYGIALWGESNRVWGGWNRIGNSKRGLKNTLYNVNWIWSFSANQEIYVHQPVAAVMDGASNSFYVHHATVGWKLVPSILESSWRTVILSPGRYKTTIARVFRIGYAPSPESSDVITLL